MFLLLVLAMGIGCGSPTPRSAVIATTPITIIPLPVTVDEVSTRVTFVYSGDAIYADSSVLAIAEYLSTALHQLHPGFELTPTPSAEHAVIQFTIDPLIDGLDGYELSITSERVTIRAASPSGCFYGVQTLLQLQHETESPNALAFLNTNVRDQARFKHRGLLLDCCRHFVEKEAIKRYIELLARYKMNVFHWHLTEDQGWRLQSTAYPKLTEIGAWRKQADGSSYGGYYTQNEVIDIVKHAEKHFVTVIPEIELPGHSSAAIASYPWLSCFGDTIEVATEWGVFKDIYCAGSDTTLRFLETIFDEVMALFPSEHIHIGGDEAPKQHWENCPKCQQRIRDEGLADAHELQSWMVAHFAQYLNEHGKKLIGWDEILEGGLPAGCTVQAWRGTEGGIQAAQLGADAIMSPTSHAYFDYGVHTTDLEQVYRFNPVPSELTPDESRHIIGGECNMWTEHAPQHTLDSKLFPRLLAMAEVLWTPQARRVYSEFYQRVQREYPRLDAQAVQYGPEGRSFAHTALERHTNQWWLPIERKTSFDSVQYTFGSTRKNLELNEDRVQLPKTQGAHHLQLFAFKNQSIDTVKIGTAIHEALFAKVERTHPYSAFYTAGGDAALTDGLIGSHDFRDGFWQAYSGHDLEATLYFDEHKRFNTLEFPIYVYGNAWIFPPEFVELSISDNGVDWELITRLKNPLNEGDPRQGIVMLSSRFDTVTASQVRIRAKNRGVCPPWHDAAGEPAWLFCSEIMLMLQ